MDTSNVKPDSANTGSENGQTFSLYDVLGIMSGKETISTKNWTPERWVQVIRMYIDLMKGQFNYFPFFKDLGDLKGIYIPHCNKGERGWREMLHGEKTSYIAALRFIGRNCPNDINHTTRVIKLLGLRGDDYLGGAEKSILLARDGRLIFFQYQAPGKISERVVVDASIRICGNDVLAELIQDSVSKYYHLGYEILMSLYLLSVSHAKEKAKLAAKAAGLSGQIMMLFDAIDNPTQ